MRNSKTSNKPVLNELYIEHVVFGVFHHVGWQHVERYEVSHPALLGCGVHFIKDIGVDHILAGREVVFYLFLGVHELYYVFSILANYYSRPVLISLVRLAISFFTTGLNGRVGYSGRLYSFFTIGIVWLGLRPEKPISMSFLGLSDL